MSLLTADLHHSHISSLVAIIIITILKITRALRISLLARRPSSRPKDGQFSEMGDFRRPVLGGHLRTSVLNETKQCL